MKNGELNTTRYLAVTRIIVQDWGVKSIYFLPSLPLVEKKKETRNKKALPSVNSSVAMQEFSNKYEYRNLLPLAESDM